MNFFKKYLPYIVALATFIVVSLSFFSPVLEGKEILQSDIVQFTGMSKEIQDFRAEYGEEPYWTDAAFGGMPAFQVSALYAHDYIKKLDNLIRFLPRPADYLFLYFVGFFILMLAFKVDWRLALIGALGFGLSTYYIVIIGVGHNAKAHAIGYFSLVMAGIVWAYQKKYLLGIILTTLATALEITAGHIQMTYYLFFALLFYGLFQLVKAFQNNTLSDFIKSTLTVLLAGILALGINANHLLPTREYASESTRSKSELKLNPDGSSKASNSALDKSYITEYSYGILETVNLLIPRFMGGGNIEDIGTKSKTFKFLKSKIGISQARDFVKHAPMYWGTQPIVAAPAYIGAVWLFLFVLFLLIVKPRQQWWLLLTIVLALLLSWGKNLNFLTNLFIDYIPLYDKFRAVSSIQVLIEWLVPIGSVLGLHQLLFNKKIDVQHKQKALVYALAIVGGFTLLILALGSSMFGFESPRDAQYESMIPGFTDVLIQDRKYLLRVDALRTLILIVLSAGVLLLLIKKKLNNTIVIAALGLLLLFDGYTVAKRYVTNDDFVRKTKVKQPFVPTQADVEILKDTTHYRVANFTVNPMNDGRTSYFHKSLGGYHAAKPRRYQELFDYQIVNGNYEIFNMLNTKYFIITDESNQLMVDKNDLAYGNAWFADRVHWVNNADETMRALDSLSKDLVILNNKYKENLPDNLWKKDSTATIALKEYKPNQLVYSSNTKQPQVALFSEQFYPYGWDATIDGQSVEIMQANYVLRALKVPAGAHDIVFTFKPPVVKAGVRLSLFSYLGFIIIVIVGIGFNYLRKK